MDLNVEPMIYPLFYPYGSQDWHRNLKKRVVKINGKNDFDYIENDNEIKVGSSEHRVSRCDYIKYRIAICDEELNSNLFFMVVDYFNSG